MKRTLALLVCTAALGAMPSFAADVAPTVRQPSANQRVSVARDAIKNQDWKKSLAELNLAVKEEPRNADAHNLLGYSYREGKSATASTPSPWARCS